MSSSKRTITKVSVSRNIDSLIDVLIYWLSLSALILVPTVFSTWVYRLFSCPKYLVLLAISAALLPLVVYKTAIGIHRRGLDALPKHSMPILLVLGYVTIILLSTLLGIEPLGSFLGTFENRMGLVTRVCFLICFAGITIGVGKNRYRAVQLLWAMVITGFVVALYAFIQFFGRDPFLPETVYLFRTGEQTVRRAVSTVGHPDYLGNFLLYTTPLTASLALAYRGIARQFAVIATGVSLCAITFSGTRGAWVGLFGGVLLLAMIELIRRRFSFFARPAALLNTRVLTGVMVILVSVGFIASTRVSRNIIDRARLLVSTRDAGAGRTLLWRDSLRMIPAYPLIGSGPDAFRRAFLPYKSFELARLAPDTNNESSHDSYIDAAVCFGLPGAVVFVSIIATTFFLLLRARRRSSDPKIQLMIMGLVGSFASVTIHNIFIFDQITTGLYFFGFVAMAIVISRVSAMEDENRETKGEVQNSKFSGQLVKAKHHWAAAAALILAPLFFIAAVTQGVVEMRADHHINEAFRAASQGNLDGVLSSAGQALNVFDPNGGFALLAAQSVAICIDHINEADRASRRRSGRAPSAPEREALNFAIINAQRSLAHTLTPDSSCVLMAYLSLLAGDGVRVKQFASDAVSYDSKFANSRWLLAEGHLAVGEREQAIAEAKSSLDLKSALNRSRFVIERAQGEDETRRQKKEKALASAREVINRGNPEKAKVILLRLISKSPSPCPECHSELASLYEAEHLYEQAIAEWQIFIAQTPDRASAKDAEKHISALRLMSGPPK